MALHEPHGGEAWRDHPSTHLGKPSNNVCSTLSAFRPIASMTPRLLIPYAKSIVQPDVGSISVLISVTTQLPLISFQMTAWGCPCIVSANPTMSPLSLIPTA